MARQPAARPPRRRKRVPGGEIHFERHNMVLFGAGLASIVIGYVLLGAGSMTAAPFLLVLGYCFLVPVSLLWRTRTSGDQSPGTRPRETTPRS